MTYLQFHLIFTLPLFALMLFLTRSNPWTFSKKGVGGTLLLLFLALTYTTPWDSYLIHQNIWQYRPENIIGTFLKIPFEEYFFFIIQTIIGCFLTSYVLFRLGHDQKQKMQLGWSQVTTMAILFSALIVLFIVRNQQEEMRYLNLILFWSLPILILQWSLGLDVLLRHKRTWFLTVGSLTAYFCFADSVAIKKQIWTFPQDTISGINLFGVLPLEEALFFLVTNLMVVQGYILFTAVDFGQFHFNFTTKKAA